MADQVPQNRLPRLAPQSAGVQISEYGITLDAANPVSLCLPDPSRYLLVVASCGNPDIHISTIGTATAGAGFLLPLTGYESIDYATWLSMVQLQWYVIPNGLTPTIRVWTSRIP